MLTLSDDRPELGLRLQYVELPYISDAVCMVTGWQNPFFAIEYNRVRNLM